MVDEALASAVYSQAPALNSNRTPSRKTRWTQEQIEALIEGVEKYGLSAWRTIVMVSALRARWAVAAALMRVVRARAGGDAAMTAALCHWPTSLPPTYTSKRHPPTPTRTPATHCPLPQPGAGPSPEHQEQHAVQGQVPQLVPDHHPGPP
jgi:hypothetical protein